MIDLPGAKPVDAGGAFRDRVQWSRADGTMIRLVFGLFLFALVFAQATFIPRMNPFPITPDLALVVLFFWMTQRSLRESLAWVFVVGMVMDVLAMDPLGVHALAMIPMVAMAYPLRVRPWQFHLFSVMALVLMGSLMHGALLSIFRGQGVSMEVGIQAVLQTLLVPVVYIGYRIVSRR
jgi:rod shape-determining protein MreD